MATPTIFAQSSVRRGKRSEIFLRKWIQFISDLSVSATSGRNSGKLQRFTLPGSGGSNVEILVWGVVKALPAGERVRLALSKQVTIVTKDVVLHKHATFKASNGLSVLVYDGTKPLFAQRFRSQCPTVTHVPRPMNAFILFRRAKHEQLLKSNPNLRNCDISKIAAEEWRDSSDDHKEIYKKMAMEQVLKHRSANPDYKYSPTKVIATTVNDSNDIDGVDLTKHTSSWASHPSNGTLDELLSCLDGALQQLV